MRRLSEADYGEAAEIRHRISGSEHLVTFGFGIAAPCTGKSESARIT